MVESQLVELDDVRTAALVVGMTALAVLFPDLVFFAVKSAAFIDILFDFFVAIKTQRGLAVSVEAVMTLGTFMLDFGVSLDQFTRHDQGFDGGGVAR
jgi:hypothetical protein